MKNLNKILTNFKYYDIICIDNLCIGAVTMNISKNLVKGSTSLLILSVLSREPMYGYQIIKELECLSENVFSLKEGTLYPILHSLEKEKFLEAYWEETKSERKRKYYRITKKGLNELNSKAKEFKTYSTAVNRVIGGATLVGI